MTSDQVVIEHSLYVGDRAVSIAHTLVDADGAARDLTGCMVAFRMVAWEDEPTASPTVKVNNAAAVVDSEAAGTVHYAWAAGDVDTAGVYECFWIRTITATGLVERFPTNGKRIRMTIGLAR